LPPDEERNNYEIELIGLIKTVNLLF